MALFFLFDAFSIFNMNLLKRKIISSEYLAILQITNATWDVNNTITPL